LIIATIKWRHINSLIKAHQRLARGFRKGLGFWARRTLKLFRAKLGAGRGTVHSRSGSLARSFTYLVKGTNKIGTLSAALQSDAVQARLLEYGGIVRPVKAKVLAIPIWDRIKHRKVFRSPLRRTLPKHIKLWRSSSGHAFLADIRKRPPRPWYLLVPQARVRPQLRFRKHVEGRLRPLVTELAKRAREELRRG